MVISRQDLSVVIYWLLGYSGIRNFFLRLRRKPIARFVTFHDIQPSALRQFEKNVRFLKKKTNVISLDDFFDGRWSSRRLNIVITFDDGYKSWVNHAVPLFLKLEVPATFFVSSGFIGRPEEHEAEFGPNQGCDQTGHPKTTGCLYEEDLKMMVGRGFTVGGHTLNHKSLSDLHDNGRLKEEIVKDKKELELITGRTVRYFAYPFGANHNPGIDLVTVLRESGYRGAVTTISGFNIPETDPYMLHRELTRTAMPSWTFRAIVHGNKEATRKFNTLFGIMKSGRFI